MKKRIFFFSANNTANKSGSISPFSILFRAICLSALLLLTLSANAQSVKTWTGTNGTNWDDPSNWSPFGVPGLNNLVDISPTASGNDPEIAYTTTAAAREVRVFSGGELTIYGKLNLSPANTSDGIYNEGTITNEGEINISRYNGQPNDDGIDNRGIFINRQQGNLSNSGLINIDGIDDKGIVNQLGGSFTNEKGTINIGTASNPITVDGVLNLSGSLFHNQATLKIMNTGDDGIQNEGSFINNTTGIIYIDQIADVGITNLLAFTNSGEIRIGETASIGDDGIFNGSSADFSNNVTGTIQIDQTANFGILNFQIFTNSGEIRIGETNTTGDDGINSSGGTFTNYATGVIHIYQTADIGLANFNNFTNNGEIWIGESGTIGNDGIYNGNAGIFNNNATGVIQIGNTTDTGITNNEVFTNKGTIKIGEIGSIGTIAINNFIFNGSSPVFLNSTCSAVIHIFDKRIIDAANSFTNSGTILQESAANSNIETNNGLILYNSGSFTVDNGDASVSVSGSFSGKKIWTGCNNNAWETAANWYPGGTPTTSDDVVIYPTGTDPVISGTTSAVANSFTVQAGGQLTVNTGGNLTLNDVIVLSGNLIIQNGASVSGTRLTLESGATLTNNGSIASTTYLIWNKSGATMQGNGQYFSAASWYNQGTFNPGTSHVTFNGNSGGSINGTGTISFYDLEMLNGNATTLEMPVTVEHEIIMTAGHLNLSGFTLTLNGAIINERAASRIYGNGTITKTLTLNAPNAVNPGNIGVTITSSANLGSTTLQRGHVVQDVNGEPSIFRYYEISPANNSGLDATVRFHYLDWELDGIPENELTSFRYNGTTWDNYPVTARDATANWVETENVDAFSKWTLADCGVPVTFYADTDGDGYGDPAVSGSFCDVPSGYVADNTDCDDGDADEFPGQTWYEDADGDGYTTGTSQTACERPAGYKTADELVNTTDIDCNDTDAYVNPNPDCTTTTRTWTGHISTAWNEACNWSPNCVPTANEDVVIPDETNDPIISGATAAVARSVTMNDNSHLTIQNNGSLSIDNAVNDGLSVSGYKARVTNHGVINIGATAIGGRGIYLSNVETLLSNDGAIHIMHTASDGIYASGYKSYFKNEFESQVFIGQSGGSIGGHGINLSNRAEMSNQKGAVVIDNTAQDAINAVLSSPTYLNLSDGQTLIGQHEGNIQGRGITCSDCRLDNSSSTVRIDNTSQEGIYINDGSIFSNDGGQIIIGEIGNIGGNAISASDALLTNYECSLIKVASDNLITYSGSAQYFKNDGTIIENASGNSNIGTNNGIINNLNGGNFSVVNNNEIVVESTTTTDCSSVSPAFSLGVTVGFNILGIFTDASATQSAGTYDAGTNTFTPANGLTQPSYVFYVKIEDPVGGCTRIVEWTVNNNGNVVTGYLDSDGDGYGDPSISQLFCEACEVGYVLDNTDCNDNDENEFPDQVWYVDFDDDGYPGNGIMASCERPTGFKLAGELISLSPIDCDDNDPAVHVAQIWYRDEDNDNYTSGAVAASCHRPPGYKLAGELVNITDIDCNDTDANANPSPDCSTITRIWTGHISTDWDEPCNWSPNCVPTAGENVVIPNKTNDPVISVSTAAVAKSVEVKANALLMIVSGGSLTIDGSISHGLENNGTVTNMGTIAMGHNTAISENGINNNAYFTNDGGIIDIRNTLGNGIRNQNSGKFFNQNSGAIMIATNGGFVFSYGISNKGLGSIFTNSASTIEIENTGFGGVNNNADAQYKNLNGSQLLIGQNSGAPGIGIKNENGAGFLNDASTIVIDNTSNTGLYNKDYGATFENRNNALMVIGENEPIGTWSVLNSSSSEFNNLDCSTVRLYHQFLNELNFTVWLNEGLLSLNASTASESSNGATFTNNGIIEDVEGTLPTVSNDEIIIAPTATTDCSTVSPAFDLGTPVDFNILGIFTDADATQSAGTYDVTTNIFTPTNDLSQGTTVFYVKIEDPAGGCTRIVEWTVNNTENCNGLNISGTITWEHDGVSGVNNATVNVTGAGSGSDASDTNGDYEVNIPSGTGNFTVKPVKNINKLNGVTSADITAIQQHVANIAPLPAPFKRIAADVNKSNSITAFDASLLNQALLGNPSAMNLITSWRFVPESYVFSNPNAPWGFPEQINLSDVSSNVSGQDFKGIKIGDVVSTWANPANFSAGEPLVLRIQDRVLKTGQPLDVEFRADQLSDLNSFQFALYFDPAQLALVEIEPLNGLPLSIDNFGTYNEAEGEIRMLWSQAGPVVLDEAAPIFRLRFQALESGALLSQVLRLNEDALPAHAYNSAYAESEVQIQFLETIATGNPDQGEVLSLEAWPNPFRESIELQFSLPQAGDTEIRVYDTAGRIQFSKKADYAAGGHNERLEIAGNTSGMYLVELRSAAGRAVLPLVRVDK
ncbi:MAG: T9SS type A sorting domain-containing protein [Saprospiraceae bacterium]